MNAAVFASAAPAGDEVGGLLGLVLTVIDALGAFGVGVLTLVETLFPPIPSELILPLAGFLSRLGDMNVWVVLAAATVGSYLGALILYLLGRRVGLERSITWLSRLPLVDRDDFEKAAGWFTRHGRSAIFFGRLIPGVRSLISLPAGAERMPVTTFTVFTVGGTLLWNGLLIGFGYALGSQYELVAEYADWLNYAVYAALAGVVFWLVVRALVRRRPAR